MLLCASDSAGSAVEPLAPPKGAGIGERVGFEGDGEQAPPETPNRVQKKKIWLQLQPHLKTDGEGVARFKGERMMTSTGPVTCVTLMDANIS